MYVYLDHAATTPLDEAVLAAMRPYEHTVFGNPSSIHQYGRVARVALDQARNQIAELVHATPAEIFFTSGGTEGNNMVLRGAIAGLGIQDVITSPIEHPSVRYPLEQLAQNSCIQLHFVQIDRQGRLDYDHLESLLKLGQRKTLVSLMHANHEIGNVYDITYIGALCQTYGAVFHTDIVQTLGSYAHNFEPLQLAVGSAHKLHGPKGIGMVYIDRALKIPPLLLGGAQERGMRGGTENVAGIVGFSKALEIADRDRLPNRCYIQGLKKQMIDQLLAHVPGVAFQGESASLEKSLYTVLSVRLPVAEKSDLVVPYLDMHQIAVSAGSACTSGSVLGSPVLAALGEDPVGSTVRFSFSKYNTPAEIDYTVQKVAALCC